MPDTEQKPNQTVSAAPVLKPKSRREWIFWAIYLIVVIVLFAGESAGELVENIPALRRGGELTSAQLAKLQPLALVPRPLEPHYAALVSIAAKSEGPLPGPCEKRQFIADLLPHLTAARPAIIVIDISFTDERANDTCPADAPESNRLRDAIRAAAASTPVVLGQASTSVSQLGDDDEARFERRGIGENMLVFRSPLSVSAGNVRFGLTRPNDDVERVPLRWYGYDESSSVFGARSSLALMAAEAWRATFPDRGARLKQMEGAEYHPFAAMLRENQFSTVPAIEVMCDAQRAQAQDWRHCDKDRGFTAERDKLRGRVSVVGIADDYQHDHWQTEVGNMAGYALHANYIEALLDSRTYRPVRFWWRIGISFAWFFLLELPFWRHGFSTVRALLLSAAVSALVWVFASYFALVNLGLYIGLFPPSVMLIVARVVHNWGEAATKISGTDGEEDREPRIGTVPAGV